MEQTERKKFKSLMIQIVLKIKAFFELLFKIEIKKALIPFILAGIMCSCSPSKRIERIVERYNLQIYDTTIVNADTINYIFDKQIFNHDTILTVKNKEYITKIQVNKDTIYINTYIPQKQVITKKIETPKKTPYWQRFCMVVWFSVVALCFIYLIMSFLSKKQ